MERHADLLEKGPCDWAVEKGIGPGADGGAVAGKDYWGVGSVEALSDSFSSTSSFERTSFASAPSGEYFR